MVYFQFQWGMHATRACARFAFELAAGCVAVARWLRNLWVSSFLALLRFVSQFFIVKKFSAHVVIHT